MTKLPRIEAWNIDPQELHAHQRWCATDDGVIYAHSNALAAYVYGDYHSEQDDRDNLIGMTVDQLRKLGYTVELDRY